METIQKTIGQLDAKLTKEDISVIKDLQKDSSKLTYIMIRAVYNGFKFWLIIQTIYKFIP